MKQAHIRSRRLRNKLRYAFLLLKDFFSLPFVKPVILFITALCLLLIAAPYALTKIVPPDDSNDESLTPQAAFPLTEAPDTIKIYRMGSEKTETIGFENYVKGVVSGEMPASFHIEALKAQAVAARTYSLARVLKAEAEGNPQAHPDAPLCDSTHCQVYKSIEELEKTKGSKWMEKDWPKICRAVDSTRGQLLYYKGGLVEQALFHSSSGGRTENSEDVFAAAVPYLVSVESPYEDTATHKKECNSFSLEEFSSAVRNSCPDIVFGSIDPSNIKIISRSSGNRVEKIQIGNAVLTGRKLREILDLPSSNFEISFSKDSISFTSDGSGHGVGMSQYGADGMAKKGYDYKKILSHYYSGTEVY